MKRYLLSAGLTLSAIIPFTVAGAMADESDQGCADLVKECFAYSRSERDHCFKGVAGHPFCVDTRIAALAEKRLALSPSIPDSIDGGPAFLGPQLVDSDCLANFDSAWSAALINGSPTEDEYKQLTSNLDQCARIPASEVVRP